MQMTPRVCSVSLKHSSSGARNFPRLNIIISSSAGEELPKGNVTFPAMLACLERAFVAMWNSATRARVLVLFCRRRCFVGQMEIKPLPWLGVWRGVKSRAGSEMGSQLQSEQKSEHPRRLASCNSVAKAEPRCFPPVLRPARSPHLLRKR